MRRTPQIEWPVITAKQFAELLDVTPGAVQTWIDEGLPSEPHKPGQARRIALAAALRWLFDRRRRRLSVRDRLADEQADKFGLENARKRGELMRIADVSFLLSEMGANLVARMDAVPGRVAGELAGIDDSAVIRTRLLDELRGVRSTITDAVTKLAELAGSVADAGGDSPPASEAHVKRMGRRKSHPAKGERGTGPVAEL